MTTRSENPIGQFLSGSAAAAIARVAGTAGMFLTSVLLARMLSPSEVGVYFLVYSVLMFLVPVAHFNIPIAIVRFLSRTRELNEAHSDGSTLKKSALLCMAVVAIVCAVYAIAGGQLLGHQVFSNSEFASVSKLAAIWLFLLASQALLVNVLRGLQLIKSAAILDGPANNVALALVMAIWWSLHTDISIEAAIAISVIVLTIVTLFSLGKVLRSLPRMNRAGTTDLPGIIRVSAPLLVGTLAIKGSAELHMFVLGNQACPEDIALYGVAIRVAKFVVFPLLVVNSILPPLVARMWHAKSCAKLEDLLRISATMVSVPALLIVVGLALFSAPLMESLFGAFYSRAGSILWILLLGQLVNALTGSPGVLLAMADHQRFVMMSGLLTGIVGLAITFSLVNRVGAEGAALGFAVGVSTHNILMWYYCKKVLKIRTHVYLKSWNRHLKSLCLHLKN